MNRFYFLLPISCCLLFFSCGQEEKQVIIPAHVLPKEKMAQVITDIHIAEAEINLRVAPDSASTEKLSFQKIFDKNQIAKAQYDTSLSFYIDHPDLLNDIYSEVMNELSKMQGTAK